MSPDARRLVAGQGIRAFGYGFTAVTLGRLLADRGYGGLRSAVLLTVMIAGTAVASLLLGVLADRVGRRRCYGWLFAGIAVSGAIVAVGAPYWLLLVVAATGTLSTDVVDNGPATTLEQVMLAAEDAGSARAYGAYNAVGAGCGALGALAVAASGGGAGWFAVLIPVGLGGVMLAAGLSRQVEQPTGQARHERQPTRPVVRRLAGLFAVDAAAGGLVTTGFLAYFLTRRHHASPAALGVLFFVISLVQAISVLIAPRLAARYGLVATMVGTHLPSNMLLAAAAFAPNLAGAAFLLVARAGLSQMDVPTRQALVMSVVPPDERTAAAALTNAARYTVRPAGPVIAGALQHLAAGAPLVLAGAVKAGYDLALWRAARGLVPALRAEQEVSR